MCNQLEGHLVTVDSNSTNQMLYDTFVARWPLARTGISIGLISKQPTTDRSKWSWLSGAKMSYQNWGTFVNPSLNSNVTQPDNFKGYEGECSTLAGPGVSFLKPSGGWSDVACPNHYPFVCEFVPSVTRRTNQAQIKGGLAGST